MNFEMLSYKSVKTNFPYFAMKDLGMHVKSEISAKHVYSILAKASRFPRLYAFVEVFRDVKTVANIGHGSSSKRELKSLFSIFFHFLVPYLVLTLLHTYV